MTLLELLRQELPKRGGWPEGAVCITQDVDLMVEPAACHPSVAKCDGDGFWFLDSSRTGGFEVDTLASDYTTAIITREQYEAERAIDEMVRLSGVSIGAAKILYDAGYRKG
ncbi:hypothetical protein M12a_00066 [Klebsiella phage VLCpiM12a]|uniref:hypothetical protein n=1 Tax=Klebsiella phage VLCpiM12a TaxID=2874879 RepID=UPI0023312D73|nr:hypothetical protein PQZ58_gp66 [Klebsiella phage VLCpiM12a]UVX31577.1 hypothetical protein M12a_00066 [Klebsiella phage VLCpiM12a]